MANVIVIGGGAAGLLAAGTAAQRGHQVLLLERNERPARKLMITGKGRCNVTNHCAQAQELIDHVPTNGRFLYTAFNYFMPRDIIDLLETEGVELKVERGNRVFPVSDKAVDVVDALVGWCKKQKVQFHQARASEILTENGTAVGVFCEESGETFSCNRVILATGGLSYPLTGSTGDGYAMAEQVGHTIVTPQPALVPLVCHEGFCADLQGLSLRNVTLSAVDTATYKEIYHAFGEMLFTHFGVSGPLVLSASSHMTKMEKGRYELHIDLKPALSHEQLDARVQRDFLEFSNKNFINALDHLLPKKLVPVVVRLVGVKPQTKVNQITREQRGRLVNLLKDLTVTVNGFRPIEEAVVTRGGVNVKEINPKTMQSKLVEGLFFAGEVIDVDAYTGGFNLQIAFATGHLAGKNV